MEHLATLMAVLFMGLLGVGTVSTVIQRIIIKPMPSLKKNPIALSPALQNSKVLSVR
jgi:hypothetical protein